MCVYVPQQTSDGRQLMNNVCKFGDATYVKPPGQEPSKNLLADNNLLLAGKLFSEARWTTTKDYMGGLPAGTYGCMQWTVINKEHANLIVNLLESLLADTGACTECPLQTCLTCIK